MVAVALGVCLTALVLALRSSLLDAAQDEAAARAENAKIAIEQGRRPDSQVTVLPPTTPAPSPVTTSMAPPQRPVTTSPQPTVTVPVSDGRVVVAQVETKQVKRALDTLWTLLVPGIPLVLGIVGLATWIAVGRALRPVEAIRAEVAEIAGHDLGRRVPVPGSGDEIARLATTMNATLDRLEHAVVRNRRFVADASHELRSPIAALRTQLELAAHGQGDWSRDAHAALADTERLQALADDLLLLARMRDGGIHREQVDLGQLAIEEARGVRLDIRPDVLVDGSARHLSRLVRNLVQNARRHAGSTVLVRVRPGVLEVHDDGPGIPPADRARVFEPFTRLDDARTRDDGGTGLGLAIVRDIAVAHGVTVRVADSPLGGAVVIVSWT
ncbi:sensor histidine kinase [Pseudonocardiaceae bacterium YIM PH 21723]|nr:sensor histidine kinase [Pseudonocardiaceae bacterium YIM PH 21723]